VPEERDAILEYFRTKKPAWFPLVYALFFTGARPGELAALRICDVDLERGTISITKSRDEHAEAAPKTEKSRREIPLCRTSSTCCARSSIRRPRMPTSISSAIPTAGR
jgi:integrase